MSFVLESHHTIALYQGLPVSASQQTTVYLWLQRPKPRIYSTLKPSWPFILLMTAATACFTESLIYIGSCSSQPSCWLICLCGTIYWSTSVPSNRNSENLVEVVDWSREARYFLLIALGWYIYIYICPWGLLIISYSYNSWPRTVWKGKKTKAGSWAPRAAWIKAQCLMVVLKNNKRRMRK